MIDILFQVLVNMTNTVIIAFTFVFSYWWIWAPLILILAYLEALKKFNQRVYKSELKWVVLELKIPLDVHKSPKAMEQVFSSLHAIGGVGDPAENLKEAFKNWREGVFKGKVPDWYSFEITATGGEIHFYIRCQEKHRSTIESQIFAHFPDSEITPTGDYIIQFPSNLPDDQYDVTGAELGLTKDDIIPILTYPEFEEEKAGKEDVRRIDPLAPLAEALGALLLGEFVGIEYLISSASEKWTKAWIKKGQGAIDKVLGKEEKKKTNAADAVFAGIEGGAHSVSSAFFGAVKEEKKEEKKEDKPGVGFQNVIKAIEKSVAKLQSQVGVRIVYVARKDKFIKERLSTITAPFQIFSGQALNGFKSAFSPEAKKGFNKDAKTLSNKHKLFKNYRFREFPTKPFVLNTEELATIYHFPDVGVKTPALPRIDAKKGEAPAGIPTV